MGDKGRGRKATQHKGREKRFPKQQSQPYLNFPGHWGTRKLSQSRQCGCPMLEAEKGTPRELWGTRGGSLTPPLPTHKESSAVLPGCGGSLSRKGLGSDGK